MALRLNELRNIIKEEVKVFLDEIRDQKEEKKASELHQLLQNKYKNNIRNPLYRGYNEDIDTFKIKKIRKDRKPSDTPEYLQAIVDVMAEDDKMNIPKRRESKFASADKYFAKSFGRLYIAFPKKGASIVSAEYDAWEHTLHKVYHSFGNALNHDYPNLSEKCPELAKAIKFLKITKEAEQYRYKEKFARKLWKFFDDNRSKIKTQGIESGVEELYDAFKMIKVHYLGAFDEKINKDDKEIMFDGDSYLLVDPEFFDRYFKWDKMYGNWKIKQKYR